MTNFTTFYLKHATPGNNQEGGKIVINPETNMSSVEKTNLAPLLTALFSPSEISSYIQRVMYAEAGIIKKDRLAKNLVVEDLIRLRFYVSKPIKGLKGDQERYSVDILEVVSRLDQIDFTLSGCFCTTKPEVIIRSIRGSSAKPLFVKAAILDPNNPGQLNIVDLLKVPILFVCSSSINSRNHFDFEEGFAAAKLLRDMQPSEQINPAKSYIDTLREAALTI